MTWTTLHLQVTTPLFNGGAVPGAEPDPDGTGIRVSSLRGAMRFWFRALAGAVTGPDLPLVSALERQVFGGTDNASPVRLRVPRQPAVTAAGGGHGFLPRRADPPHVRRDHPGHWVVYLLGQGLGDLRHTTPLRSYVAPGQDFELRLHLGRDEPVASLALASLWLTCAYGGLGARIRRGFGGLRVTGVTGPLPAPWSDETVLTPRLDHFEQLRYLWPAGPLSAVMPTLVGLIRKQKKDPVPDGWPSPPYPVLSKKHTRAGTSGGEPFPSWDQTLSHAGEQFRLYRASRHHSGVPYTPTRKTPEWNDVVWGDVDRFPLGALGLPVNFKDKAVVDAMREEKILRRASPLWLRPVGDDQTGWRLLSYAFLGDFLPGPDAPEARLRGGLNPRRLHIAEADITHLAEAWIDRLGQDDWCWFGPDERPASPRPSE